MELEAIYASSGGDPKTARALVEELGFRKTQRAAALKERIAKDHPAQGRQDVFSPIHSSPGGDAGDIEAPRTPERERAAPSPVDRPVVLGELPPITNKPADILSAWTALEVLSPQGFKKETDLVGEDRSAIANFEREPLPWESGHKSRPKKVLYYELYLGVMPMEPAVDALLRVYADKRVERPSMKGYSPLASVILDKDGRPLEEDGSAALSSFAWGVPVALQGDLAKLADWPAKEKELAAAFRNRLIRRDQEGDIEPLTKRRIHEIYEFLIGALHLTRLETLPPYFAIKRFEWIGNKKPPEPSLLNSFFLEDLAAARKLVASNAVPNALAHYLGIRSVGQRTDLLHDVRGLQDLLQPKLTPPGRWPGDGRHPLALLQQAAVNATMAERLPSGILGVNGPPGTGKTTLLRDVVVARVVERAKVMASFDRPAQAFSPTRVSLARNGAKITLHRLDDRLKGFEMVVASSNNKAVENVSQELPDIGAVTQDAPGLRYFSSISDRVLERDTWGLIAAVLGNGSNRYQFAQSFWKDEERGFSTYLNHACGIPQIVTTPQEKGPPLKRLRHVIGLERPPHNGVEAASRWEEARGGFRTVLAEFERKQQLLQKLYGHLRRLGEVVEQLKVVEIRLQENEQKRFPAEAALTAAQAAFRKQEQVVCECRTRCARQAEQRPGLFSRVFRTATYRDWIAQKKSLRDQLSGIEEVLRELGERLQGVRAEVEKLAHDNAVGKNNLASLESERNTLSQQLARAKADLGIVLPDAAFFGRPHEEVQLQNVWFDKASNLVRDRVFEQAMQIHRAFIDCAADALRQNLSIFLETFGTRSLGTSEKDALIPDLWATFFLVVPVVSTTFASVHRMFSRLKPETLGWLLVDEAGQAVPQAVVGAMLRTKQSVVVGDPLQIEPVVTLPNSLTEKICTRFGADPLRFNAPEASVQTLADAASSYCTKFPIGSGYREVGAPLLVHRRCNSPMFDISNDIAYANLMVQAKRQVPDNDVLGPSAWINVNSPTSADKWAPDEGAILVEMLRKLRQGGGTPDFYVVTPFVVVQDNLRKELLRSRVLDGWTPKAPGAWVFERVGTVHTVQGREAEIVFFVLGAPMASQAGARAWAGGRPNLLNVAVTRAKANVYVIGNRASWKGEGFFSALDRFLP